MRFVEVKGCVPIDSFFFIIFLGMRRGAKREGEEGTKIRVIAFSRKRAAVALTISPLWPLVKTLTKTAPTRKPTSTCRSAELEVLPACLKRRRGVIMSAQLHSGAPNTHTHTHHTDTNKLHHHNLFTQGAANSRAIYPLSDRPMGCKRARDAHHEAKD